MRKSFKICGISVYFFINNTPLKDKPVYELIFSKNDTLVNTRILSIFSCDPAAIADTEQTPVYQYNKKAVNKFYDKHITQGKIHFAIMLDNKIIAIFI